MNQSGLCPILVAADMFFHPGNYNLAANDAQKCLGAACQVWNSTTLDCGLKSVDQNKSLDNISEKIKSMTTTLNEISEELEALGEDLENVAEDAGFSAESQRMM